MSQVDPYEPTYDDFVFVNCPFDQRYARILNASVFAIHDCGFFARSALESHGSGETRIDRIVNIIAECRFGIHDISRTELDGVNNLPRFNMPLELGIFYGAWRFGEGRHEKKELLILDREQYRYQKFCSDISGQDISIHRGRADQAVWRIRDWLSRARPEIGMPSGSVIWTKYKQFETELPDKCAQMRLDCRELTFADHREVVVQWLFENSV